MIFGIKYVNVENTIYNHFVEYWLTICEFLILFALLKETQILFTFPDRTSRNCLQSE